MLRWDFFTTSASGYTTGVRIVVLLFAFAAGGCVAIPTHAKVGNRPLPSSLTRLPHRWVDVEVKPGTVLRGVLFERPGPTVLLLSGSGMSIARNAPVIEALYAGGYAVLNADYRGTGYSSGRWGTSRYIDDDAAVLWEWVRTQRPGPAGVMGISMGAVAGSQLLTHPDPPAAAVLDRPVTPKTVIRRFVAQYTHIGAFLSLLFVRTSVDVDVADQLARAAVPTRLLLPEYDTLHPPEDAAEMVQAANGHVDVVTLPGGHLSSHLMKPAAWRRSFLDFFDRHLRPGRPPAGGRAVPDDPARVARYTVERRWLTVELDRVPSGPIQLLLIGRKRIGLKRFPRPGRVLKFHLSWVHARRLGRLFGIRAVAPNFLRPIGRVRLPNASGG